MNKARGTLFVVSAPSGAGKTTLCQRLMEERPGIEFSVSYTSRAPRAGEADGRDYNFVSRDEFMEMTARGEFAEWAEVHGNLYGTSASQLREALERGRDILLDIDVQGARQIRENFKEGVYVFVMPPSLEELRRRLEERRSDTPEVIGNRLRNAINEIREYSKYDYVIVNDVFEGALKGLEAIVISNGLRTDHVDPSWVKENFFRQEEV